MFKQVRNCSGKTDRLEYSRSLAIESCRLYRLSGEK
jgi:hypothetical protein